MWAEMFFHRLAVALFLATVLASTLVQVGLAQQQYTLWVNGNPVVTSHPPTRLGPEWFVPLAPLARALGTELSLDPVSNSIRAVRHDGATAVFDGATGRILRSATLLGQVRDFRTIQVNIGLENLIFPLSGALVLFGASAREDTERAVLEIDSLADSASGGTTAGGRFLQPVSFEYNYSLVTDMAAWQQMWELRGRTLIGTSIVTGEMVFSRLAGDSVVGIRHGSLRVDLASNRSLIVGDQGAGGGVDALNNGVRGLGLVWRKGEVEVNLFGGRTASSVSASIGTAGQAVFDSTLAGVNFGYRWKRSSLSIGGNWFQGPARRGLTFGSGFSGTYARNEFRLQGVAGDFSGMSSLPAQQLVDTSAFLVSPPVGQTPIVVTPSGTIVEVQEPNQQVKGGAYGFSLSDSFRPFQSGWLTLSGQWDHYSKNFLVPRQDSRFSAVDRSSGGGSVQPFRYVSFFGGVSASSTLAGLAQTQHGYNFGINASTPGNSPVVFGYNRSTQITTGYSSSRFDISQYSVRIPAMGRFAASAIYSEVRFNSVLSRTVSETLNVNLKRLGRLGLHHELQLDAGSGFGADWSRSFWHEKADVSVGMARQSWAGQDPLLTPTVALRLQLPKHQTLTFTYAAVREFRILEFQIGGPILRPRDLVRTGGQMALEVQCWLEGRVYQDIDLDGKFTSGVDRPIPQMEVRLDDGRATVTSAAGYYRFDEVSPGTHRIRAKLAQLPANLVFAAEDSMVAAIPYHANAVDFRALPTGRIKGRVFLVSIDESGATVELPFADARVIVLGDRDTFSELDGGFGLGDLPPGSYQLRVDPSTVPAGYVVRPSVLTSDVKPGTTSGGADFRLTRPVVAKAAPTEESRGVIEGFVWENRIASNVPVAGVKISMDSRSITSTDENGHYQLLKIPAGTRKVFVLGGELPPDLATGAVDRATVSVTANQASRQDFQVFRIMSLRGKVVSQDQTPLMGAVVTLSPNQGQVTTDAAGEFLFERLIEGDYEVTVDPKSLPEGTTAIGPDHVTVQLRVGQEVAPILFQFSVKPVKPEPAKPQLAPAAAPAKQAPPAPAVQKQAVAAAPLPPAPKAEAPAKPAETPAPARTTGPKPLTAAQLNQRGANCSPNNACRRRWRRFPRRSG